MAKSKKKAAPKHLTIADLPTKLYVSRQDVLDWKNDPDNYQPPVFAADPNDCGSNDEDSDVTYELEVTYHSMSPGKCQYSFVKGAK